jgi:hypothetical protein
MAKSNFSLDNFRGEVLGSTGLARNNRFEVIIAKPRSLSFSPYNEKLISLYVEQTSIPLLNIAVKSQKIFGPSYQRPFASEYGGEGISLNFHVDRNMSVRDFFEEWMHVIVNRDNYTIGYQDEYATTINIRQLDEQDNVTYEVELLEAFPRNMNLMDLNHASSNQTHRLNVLFAYRYWQNVKAKPIQIVDVPQAISIPQVPRVDSRVNNRNTTNARLKNVTFTGVYSPGTTDENSAFGLAGGNTGA